MHNESLGRIKKTQQHQFIWTYFCVFARESTENLVILHFLHASLVHLVRFSFHFLWDAMRLYTVKRGKNLLASHLYASQQCRRIYRISYAIFCPRWHNENEVAAETWKTWVERSQTKRTKQRCVHAQMSNAFELHNESIGGCVSERMGKKQKTLSTHSHTRCPLFVSRRLWCVQQIPIRFFSLVFVSSHTIATSDWTTKICAPFSLPPLTRTVSFCFFWFCFSYSTILHIASSIPLNFDCWTVKSLPIYFRIFCSLRFCCCFWFAIIIWMPIDCICSKWCSPFRFLCFFFLTITRNTK